MVTKVLYHRHIINGGQLYTASVFNMTTGFFRSIAMCKAQTGLLGISLRAASFTFLTLPARDVATFFFYLFGRVRNLSSIAALTWRVNIGHKLQLYYYLPLFQESQSDRVKNRFNNQGQMAALSRNANKNERNNRKYKQADGRKARRVSLKRNRRELGTKTEH